MIIPDQQDLADRIQEFCAAGREDNLVTDSETLQQHISQKLFSIEVLGKPVNNIDKNIK